MANRKGRLGVGLLLGAVGGAVAAAMYAPKVKKLLHDKELEKKAKKVFGKATKDTKALYRTATHQLLKHADRVKKQAGKVDVNKYQQLVGSVVSDLQKSTKHSSQTLKKLGDSLVADAKILFTTPKKAQKSSAKKSTKKTTKKSVVRKKKK